jgi:hypothetical protein
MITITTVTDIRTWLCNVRGDLTESETDAGVEALRSSVHPVWGSDWEQWLDDHYHLVDEAVESEVRS